MAIQPIDLQVLFSQLETVSKSVAAQQQGAQLSNAIQQEESAKKQTEKNTTVQQLPEGGDEVSPVKGDGAQRNESHADSKKEGENAPPEQHGPDIEFVKDPELGRHIDVTG